MEKTYELLTKYAKMMAEQEYSTGEYSILMIDTGEGVYATKYGADLNDLKPEEVEKLNIEALPTSESGMRAMVYSQTPYCQKALREGRTFKPSLDDMAQIIGPAAVIADTSSGSVGKSLKKALGQNAGCLVLRGKEPDGKGKGYTLTVGRNLYEAVVAMTVLEKSAEITYLADRIGGVKYLNPAETRLMRLIYKKKYSKAEETAKTAETAEGVISDTKDNAVADLSGENTREQLLRSQLVEYGKKLVKSGLVQGTWGNLSIRLDDQYMLVTPSGLDYMRLTPSDMVKVDIHTLKYEGNLKPTSERGLHGEIYKRRPDVGAVIHTHSKYACVFAAALKPLPVVDEAMKNVFGWEIPLAEYGLPGTKKLMKNTVDALGENMGCIMSHHGMIACGKDMETAFENCAKVEECGKKYLRL
ncbi:MAG: class II aldolase/adducin family protein [Firmicutes bacterium]|nr:class II aldolase/adducin family protein [Bacillota bacterium]